MKQVLIQQGEAVVREVPAPSCAAGCVLVAVSRSCISIGTEMAGVRASGTPLWKKAVEKPQQVKRVVQMAMDQGLTQTRQMVRNKLETGHPTGYSASGVILKVGQGIDDLKPGDRVACAGAQCAHHAEVICVPRNLAVRIPDALGDDAACTVTLGAIALQGVRRATPTLGETFVVIGLGFIGQLTAQLLKAHGCRVIGSDLDAKRSATATQMGMHAVLDMQGDAITQAQRLTDGHGVDGVIITAATTGEDDIVSTAFQMCRKKGRVVLVGDVGLDLRREDFYIKELDFRISTSYGPGRYDANYETHGLDYPIGYVRWTENRNMIAYLDQIDSGTVTVAPLIDQVYPLDDAPAAYAKLNGGDEKPLAVLLEYDADDERTAATQVITNPKAAPAGEGKVRIALVGAGAFAMGVHLPNLQSLEELYHLQAIVSRSGHTASEAARQFGASRSTTTYEHVLETEDVDAVVICTRHDRHAAMTLAALEAGKHVLVEKPTALSRDEMDAILSFYKNAQSPPILMTGYNRRFSPCAKRTVEIMAGRTSPMIINYRMNAGFLPPDHWTHGPEGGGRNLGEACHIYDLFLDLTKARPIEVVAHSIVPNSEHDRRDDNFVATITFDDGSVATLTYTALGSNRFPKETADIFVDGMVLSLDDYKRLRVAGTKAKGVSHRAIQKGHREELEALAQAIRAGSDWPITLQEQTDAMDIALRVQACLEGVC